MILFYILMSISFLWLQITVFDLLRKHKEAEWLQINSGILFGLSILLSLIVMYSDPGYLKKDPKMDFVKLLDQLCATSLCPECKIIRTPRSRHCSFCDRCVDRYDHHCPWVDNCIGKGNFAQFYLFVFVTWLYLLSIVISIIKAFTIEFSDDQILISPVTLTLAPEDSDMDTIMRHKGFRVLSYVLLLLLCLLFLLSVL